MFHADAGYPDVGEHPAVGSGGGVGFVELRAWRVQEWTKRFVCLATLRGRSLKQHDRRMRGAGMEDPFERPSGSAGLRIDSGKAKEIRKRKDDGSSRET